MTSAEILSAARDEEPERYLAALLAPEPERSRLLAIAAFSAELRRIPRRVREPMMGEVRLQWWRDTIAAFATDVPRGHAIAEALAETVERRELPVAPLAAMTEARAFDLYDDPMPDEAAFAGYLTKTEALPFSLALTIMGNGAPAALADMAARAYGRARLLTELPHWLTRGRLPLPLSGLTAMDITADDLRQGRTTPAVRAYVAGQAEDIDSAYQALRVAIRALPRAHRLALLPAAVVPVYLRLIVAKERDPLRSPADVSPLSRIVRIAVARFLGP